MGMFAAQHKLVSKQNIKELRWIRWMKQDQDTAVIVLRVAAA